MAVLLVIGQGAFAVAPEVRIMLKTTTPSGDDKSHAVAQLVSEGAKVPIGSVKYVAASGGDWHSIVVQCTNTAQCADIVARLRTDTTHFSVVELDERRQATPISRSTAQ